MAAKSANKLGTDKPKRKAPRSAWKPGQSGNPKGRPKDGESWSGVIAAVSNMDTDDILQIIGTDNELGRMFSKMPKSVQAKYLVTIRIIAALMFEPTHGLWVGLMDRMEGKVREQISVDGTLTVEGLEAALTKTWGKDAEDDHSS